MIEGIAQKTKMRPRHLESWGSIHRLSSFTKNHCPLVGVIGILIVHLRAPFFFTNLYYDSRGPFCGVSLFVCLMLSLELITFFLI